ncbi:hypothetical protein AJ85_06040 [Alkalihalobacillus alcalophilus ATCC 27647 = CGMCC 1.3604]|uniref:Uncharacterized protein n=1 Tax=Alkalihalobacillus alcalophilus ATCC 27647 = CGMCC 1.3604 TaxID=1218173 RepID=A0A4S4K141_ALKAL|nr:hypothetical protein AJ85_06040 [Alkalihalobacillus alcalophilus ATCC 27647 = CGMCC 1.3604]
MIPKQKKAFFSAIGYLPFQKRLESGIIEQNRQIKID